LAHYIVIVLASKSMHDATSAHIYLLYFAIYLDSRLHKKLLSLTNCTTCLEDSQGHQSWYHSIC